MPVLGEVWLAPCWCCGTSWPQSNREDFHLGHSDRQPLGAPRSGSGRMLMWRALLLIPESDPMSPCLSHCHLTAVTLACDIYDSLTLWAHCSHCHPHIHLPFNSSCPFRGRVRLPTPPPVPRSSLSEDTILVTSSPPEAKGGTNMNLDGG